MFTNAPPYALPLALMVLVLVLLLVGALYKSANTRVNRIKAFAPAVALVLIVGLTDFPGNLGDLRPFWLEHALVSGALVSLLFLFSGYLVFDEARLARDNACIEEIRRGVLHDYILFWGKYGDIGPNSMRREVLLRGGDVSDARESALAARSTIAVWAQLAMHLQSAKGLMIAKSALRTFGALGSYVHTLERAISLLEIEDRSESPETSETDPEKSRIANEALQRVHADFDTANESYAELVKLSGGESPIP